MLAWDAAAMLAGCRALRRYYFKLNWVRAFATWFFDVSREMPRTWRS
jgi:hypothetical protein